MHAINSRQSLRNDIHFLGEQLGNIISAQAGEAIFQKVEAIRLAAKEARQDPGAKAQSLTHLLATLSPTEILEVARAFSHFLNLANIAEQHHRARRRREYLKAQDKPQPGSLAEFFPKWIAQGFTPESLFQAIEKLSIDLVLTAHPTELIRRTLWKKYTTISAALSQLDHSDLTAPERRAQQDIIQREILSLWQTDELRSQKPTPVDEAKRGFALAENILWDAVPVYLRMLNDVTQQYTGRSLSLEKSPIHFGSWMGGDRDGNPFVTAEVTTEVCLLARWMAMTLYENDLDQIRSELSMSQCNDVLRRRVGDAKEPYRALLRPLHVRLKNTLLWIENNLNKVASDFKPAELIIDIEDLREPLLCCYQSLSDCGAQIIAQGQLLDMLHRLACFGLSLYRLDIRQEASRHTDVIEAISTQCGKSYIEMSELERQKFLLALIQKEIAVDLDKLAVSENVEIDLDVFRALKKQLPDALGAYIISMAQSPSDVLAVIALQVVADLPHPLRVVPLFESAVALENAGACLESLLRIPWYRDYLKMHWHHQQEIMIGYSDSAKDAGPLKAQWLQYQAQEKLTALAHQYGVTIIFFHGRGGSVSRGGAPAHAAILSQPPGAVHGQLRITEQGEVIQQKFGTLDLALRNLEVYTTATLEATLCPPPEPKQAWRDVMDALSQTAHEVYQNIVKADPRFLPYFHQVTPINALTLLIIGSRPSRRQNNSDLSQLRAIPWIFAWTQTRFMLPAWLGVGSAFTQAFDDNKQTQLQKMRVAWPFFSAFLDMLEMVFAKADLNVAMQYQQHLVADDLQDFGDMLVQEFQQTQDMLLKILHHHELLETNPVIQRSIALRNPYVDPLNLLQIELLSRLRKTSIEAADPILQRALLITINGIAAGMRNTG